ncbi:MAG: hypothetical protein JXR68_02420 [Bacteroidales bacterium]|nr:hypothetical protein [Bacteroidales bacterium]
MKIKLFYFALLLSIFAFSCKPYSRDNNDNNQDVDEQDTTQSSFNNNDVDFEFAFVSSNKYIVLEADADTAISTGKAYSPIGYADYRYSAVRDISADFVPSEYQNIVGKTVLVSTKAGDVFEVKITSVKMIADCIPHFGTVQTWDGYLDGNKYTDAQKAAQIWNMGDHFVVAEFETSEQIDDEIVFAVPDNDIKPFVYPSSDKNSEKVAMRQRILDGLSGTKIFNNYQNMYVEYDDTGQKWWNNSDIYEVFSFIETKPNEIYVALYQALGNPCGGEYFYTAFSVSKFRTDGLIETMYLTEQGFDLVLAIDYNGDGELEYIVDNFYGKRILIFLGEPDWVNKFEWTIPFLDCPC